MKLNSKNQKGFAVVEAALIILVVAVIGFMGYRIMNKNSTKSTGSDAAASQASLPAKIQSKAEVSESIKALDSTPISTKLDSSQLDNDISSLL